MDVLATFIFSPMFFDIMIVSFVMMLITKMLRHRYINKTIEAFKALPDERRQRIIRLYKSAISVWRMFRWIAPFFLLLWLLLLGLLIAFPDLSSAFPDFDLRQLVILMGVAFVVAVIHMAEDLYYKKKILKAIEPNPQPLP